MRDWTALEAEYITTKTSYKKLAEKYSISSRTITDYAKKHNWVEKRKQYCADVVAKVVAFSSQQDVSKLNSLIKSADTMAKIIDKVVTDDKQFQRHLVQIKGKKLSENEDAPPFLITEWCEEQIFEKADTKAIRDIVASLKDLTAVVRNLNNLPTQAEAEAQSLAKERFELERQKADLDGDEGKEIKVIIGGEAEDYAQ